VKRVIERHPGGGNGNIDGRNLSTLGEASLLVLSAKQAERCQERDKTVQKRTRTTSAQRDLNPRV